MRPNNRSTPDVVPIVAETDLPLLEPAAPIVVNDLEQRELDGSERT
jgi:hypothetical protein